MGSNKQFKKNSPEKKNTKISRLSVKSQKLFACNQSEGSSEENFTG